MPKLKITVRYTVDDDGITAQVLEIPEAISFGMTMEEAERNIMEALSLVLEDRLEASQAENASKSCATHLHVRETHMVLCEA